MRFVKGKSGNPGGRKKGSGEISRFIKSKTRDCREIAERMLEIARTGKEESDRIRALAWLTDRAIGKVVEVQDVTTRDATPAAPVKAPWTSQAS